MSGSVNLKSKLLSIKERGLYRDIINITSPQGALVKIENQELINFCSNDYLGLANDERLRYALCHAVEKYGIGSGASPLVCGHSEAHQLLEDEVAHYTGRERAIVFSSGYLANLAVATVLGPGRGGEIIEDRLNHASLIDGAILNRSSLIRYQHRDMPSLRRAIARKNCKKLVLTDAVFSMDGDIAPLMDIANMCKDAGVLLAVDDAHGFGVIGNQGGGTLISLGLGQDEVPLLVITFGKAVGVAGACVAGPEELIEMLIQKARPYIYSTAMPPALAVTITASLKIIKEESSKRLHLQKLINKFRSGAKERSLPVLDSTTPIQPLILGSNEAAIEISRKLFMQDIFVSAIRPPTVPANSARLRITLTAAHTETQVNKLLEALSAALH